MKISSKSIHDAAPILKRRVTGTFLTLLIGLSTLCLAVASSTDALAEPPQTILLDGEFGDWTASDLVATDPVGDSLGVFDLQRIHARRHGTALFIRLDFVDALNLQNGQEDELGLQLIIGLSEERRLTIDFRGRQAILETSDAAVTIPWQDLRFATLPTYANSQVEMVIDLGSMLDESADTISIQFAGSDELPAVVKLSPIPASSSNDSAIPSQVSGMTLGDRIPRTIRLASVNTLHQGTQDSQRAPLIAKMLGYADADVYCFNEEWDEQVFDEGVANVLPAEFQDPDQRYWSDGCGIVSKLKSRRIPFDLKRGVAVLVEAKDGSQAVVISVHLKCCGYVGSREDEKRIAEVSQLILEIQRMRGGMYGRDLMDLGVAVVGDFNLVGSIDPLSLLRQEGIRDVMLRSPVDGSAMTWRGMVPTESFWPGRLDYMTLESPQLRLIKGQLVNASDLRQIDKTFEFEETPTDHAMLVADLSVATASRRQAAPTIDLMTNGLPAMSPAAIQHVPRSSRPRWLRRFWIRR